MLAHLPNEVATDIPIEPAPFEEGQVGDPEQQGQRRVDAAQLDGIPCLAMLLFPVGVDYHVLEGDLDERLLYWSVWELKGLTLTLPVEVAGVWLWFFAVALRLVDFRQSQLLCNLEILKSSGPGPARGPPPPPPLAILGIVNFSSQFHEIHEIHGSGRYI
jgi:hypothetical protein